MNEWKKNEQINNKQTNIKGQTGQNIDSIIFTPTPIISLQQYKITSIACGLR